MGIYRFYVWQLFLLWVIVYISIIYLTENYIFSDAYYHTSLGSELSEEKILQFTKVERENIWLGYILTPVFLMIKWVILSGIIFTGLFVAEDRIRFIDCLKIITFAEFAPGAASVTKAYYFLMHKPDTLDDFQTFYPLSAVQLINKSAVPNYLLYAIQQLNVFEILYWLLLIMGVYTYTQKKIRKCFTIVACSYGAALGAWILFVVFMQLQYNS